jgi:cleavage and polyadenylation specificity factor subunit 1
MPSLLLTFPYPFTGLTIPTFFRIVRNDYVSKALSHGILDGRLLTSFEDLTLIRQSEITRQIGTERSTVLHDLNELGGSW